MSIVKQELRRLLASPLMWTLVLIFFAYNCFQIYISVGHDSFQTDLHGVQKIIAHTDADPLYEDYYDSYRQTHESSYDALDMRSILQMKEDLYNYHPTGSYASFIDSNYEKLQARVSQIKAAGDHKGDFYPGEDFEIHDKLYGILKSVMIEMMIMMSLCVLYLMDYERIHHTSDLVFSSMVGRKAIDLKWIAGLICGIVFGTAILSASLIVFFLFVPMNALWNVPVSSYMVMEPTGIWIYPFVTFTRLTILQELLLHVLVALLLMFMIGIWAGAVQKYIYSSYLSILVLSGSFITLLAVPFVVPHANWINMIARLNPAVLWQSATRWFMEHDIALSFAWNEFFALAVWGAILVGFGVFAARHFQKKDL